MVAAVCLVPTPAPAVPRKPVRGPGAAPTPLPSAVGRGGDWLAVPAQTPGPRARSPRHEPSAVQGSEAARETWGLRATGGRDGMGWAGRSIKPVCLLPGSTGGRLWPQGPCLRGGDVAPPAGPAWACGSCRIPSRLASRPVGFCPAENSPSGCDRPLLTRSARVLICRCPWPPRTGCPSCPLDPAGPAVPGVSSAPPRPHGEAWTQPEVRGRLHGAVWGGAHCWPLSGGGPSAGRGCRSQVPAAPSAPHLQLLPPLRPHVAPLPSCPDASPGAPHVVGAGA